MKVVRRFVRRSLVKFRWGRYNRIGRRLDDFRTQHRLVGHFVRPETAGSQTDEWHQVLGSKVEEFTKQRDELGKRLNLSAAFIAQPYHEPSAREPNMLLG